VNWELIARTLVHETTIAVLEAIYEARAPISAVQIARDRPEALGVVAHHVRKLHAAGLIVPAGTRQRRGAVEHLYRVANGL
jgi:hypothetical protein